MERAKVGLLLAKTETTYGTDPTPAAGSNIIAAWRGTVNFEAPSEPLDRQILDGGYAIVAGHNTKKHGKLRFRTELRGNRTNGTADDISKGAIGNLIDIDPVLQACDLDPTYTAESGASARDGFVTYQPKVPVDAGKSVTFYFYSEGKMYEINGGKGNVTVALEAGKICFLDWDFSGLFNAPIDSAIPGGQVWLDTKPPLFELRNTYAAQAVTMDFSTDKVTLTAHGLLNGDRVKFAGTLPTGLTVGTWYYVRDKAANDFKLATNIGGSAIDMTVSNGSGITMTSAPAVVYGEYEGHVISRLNIGLGNQLVMRDDANKDNSIAGFLCTDRSTSGDFDPESVKEATHPFWSKWSSRAAQDLLAQIGSDTGNRITVSAKTYLDALSYEDRNGRRIQSARFAVRADKLGNNTGTEFTLRFH